MELTIHASAWLSRGCRTWGMGQAVRYEVEGLPTGEQVSIADFGGDPLRWRILKIKNAVAGEWTGNHESAEEALKTVCH